MSEDSAKEAARKRNEAWERMNCPVAPAVLTQAQYEREYRSRMRFINRSVLESWQSATKALVCPACLVEGEHGSLIGGKLFICIEDDILTTFKAMAHCICHRCGFEEYYPMTHDPRMAEYNPVDNQQLRQAAYNQQLAQGQQAIQNVAGIAQRNMLNQMANQLSQQFPGWAQNERESLLNLYKKFKP